MYGKSIIMTYSRPDLRYPKSWNSLRFVIFKEYGYRCSKCQAYSKGKLHLHHLIPLGRGGSNYKNNLVPLCESCHYEVHFKMEKRNKWVK